MQKHLVDAALGERHLTFQQKETAIGENDRESAIISLSPLLVFVAPGLPRAILEANAMLVKEETFLGM